MKKQRICLYCGEDFEGKRITSRFCSDSCRQMYYRKRNNPEVYAKIVPVMFELNDNQYKNLLEKAQEKDMHPYDYAKKLVLDEDNDIKITFSRYEQQTVDQVRMKHGNASPEELIKRWFLERARQELKK